MLFLLISIYTTAKAKPKDEFDFTQNSRIKWTDNALHVFGSLHQNVIVE